ncbi:MAG TPA: efflux RND transporter periplasmic adaptor subunit [Myxococcota bacterium]|nr:efflux RND transporter periplasmic adaptor subunit [Myxococcota bacterium]
MAEAERSRAGREDLAALRIDRGAQPTGRRPRWVGWLVAAALALAFAAASLAAYRLTLGRVASVRVGYASVSGAGAVPAGELLTGSGYVVTGDRYISLGVRVPSRIERYLVEEGQQVKAGDPLVQLDARQYQAALDSARADLLHARADVELRRKELVRSRELEHRNVSSQADLDVAENRLRVADAEVARLEANVAKLQVDLEDTVVRAPTSGVILEKMKEVGEIAVPGGFAGSGDLIRMANLEDIRAEVDVNEADLARVRLGQPARVTPDAYPERHYDARVVKMYPQINRQKGTLKVEVKIREPDAWLKPDMSVRIGFLADAEPPGEGAAAGDQHLVVLAPREAMRSEAGSSFTWVVTDGRLRRQPVELAGTSGDQVVVTKGLAGGEALVLGDVADLREGERAELQK